MKKIILAFDPDILPLAKKTGRLLKAPVLKILHRRFPDGESLIRVPRQVRGAEVLFFVSLVYPNEKILPLILAAKTCRQLKGRCVTLVSPYLPYMRQDKSFHPGEAVAAPVFADMLSRSFDRVVTIDPHLHRIHSLRQIFSIPTVTLTATHSIAEYIHKKIAKPLLIGPDAESKQWLQKAAEKYGFEFVVLKKKRYSSTKVRIVWDKPVLIRARTAVVVDDIVSSGWTMIEIVQQLKKAGFQKIVCIAVHPIFAGDSYERLKKAGATLIVSCNTIPHRSNTIDVSRILKPALK